jgi:hypothetical protein
LLESWVSVQTSSVRSWTAGTGYTIDLTQNNASSSNSSGLTELGAFSAATTPSLTPNSTSFFSLIAVALAPTQSGAFLGGKSKMGGKSVVD